MHGYKWPINCTRTRTDGKLPSSKATSDTGIAEPIETRGAEWLSTAMSPESDDDDVDCEGGGGVAATVAATTGVRDTAKVKATAITGKAGKGTSTSASVESSGRYAVGSIVEPPAPFVTASLPAREAVAWEWLPTMLVATMQLVGLASLEHWQHDSSTYVMAPL